MIIRIIIFLLINFGGLWFGGQFSSAGASSEWYNELTKAPWTPPGWMFGFAWTAIMICYSLYMAFLWKAVENKTLLGSFYILQVLLNVGWNPVFFYLHDVWVALWIISALTFLVFFKIIYYRKELGLKSFLLAPYALWLGIATSLNAYIYLYNPELVQY